jgi:thiamine-phosphate pyrophosphorylase
VTKQSKFESLRVYALLTERHCAAGWQETAERLLAGGVDALQFREKDLPDGALIERARLLRRMTARAGALLIVNDRPDIALLSRADGVHLGRDDLRPVDVRNLLGGGFIIGLSTHSAEQAALAHSMGADYVGAGPFAPTATKGYDDGGGPDLIRAIAGATPLPKVAIGGITPENAAEAVAAGTDAVAACSTLCGADDPERAARELREAVEMGLERRGDSGE